MPTCFVIVVDVVVAVVVVVVVVVVLVVVVVVVVIVGFSVEFVLVSGAVSVMLVNEMFLFTSRGTSITVV